MRSERCGHSVRSRCETQSRLREPEEYLHHAKSEKQFMRACVVRVRQIRVSLRIKGCRIKYRRFYNESRRQRPALDMTRKQENAMQCSLESDGGTFVVLSNASARIFMRCQTCHASRLFRPNCATRRSGCPESRSSFDLMRAVRATLKSCHCVTCTAKIGSFVDVRL